MSLTLIRKWLQLDDLSSAPVSEKPGVYQFPWGPYLFLEKFIGKAIDCNINEVSTHSYHYTGSESVHVPGRFTTSGDYVLGTSVNVPVSRTSSFNTIKSTFTLKVSEQVQKKLSCNYKIIPIHEGDQITVVQSYLKGVGPTGDVLRYLFNHDNGLGMFFKDGTAAVGIHFFTPDDAWRLIKFFFLFVVLSLVNIYANSFHLVPFIVMQIIFYLLVLAMVAPWGIMIYRALLNISAYRRKRYFERFLRTYASA